MSNSTNVQVAYEDQKGWASLWLYCLYCLQGIVIGGGNFLVAFSILRFRALRSKKDFSVIAGLSFADGWNQSAFLAAGSYRIMLLLNGIHDGWVTPWSCMHTLHIIIWAYSETIAAMMLAIVSLDRLLAVILPLKYLTWDAGVYQIFMIGVPYIGTFIVNSLVWPIAIVQNVNETAPAICYIEAVIEASPVYMGYYSTGSSVCGMGSVCIYVLVWIVFKKTVGKVNPESNAQKRQLDRQRRLTISLGISCLCTFCLSVIPLQIGHYVAAKGYTSFMLAAFITANLNPLCNVLIYWKRQPEIRTAFFSMIACKSMPVDLRLWTTGTATAVQSTHNTQGGATVK